MLCKNKRVIWQEVAHICKLVELGLQEAKFLERTVWALHAPNPWKLKQFDPVIEASRPFHTQSPWKLQHLEPLRNYCILTPCIHKIPGPEILGKLRAISCISFSLQSALLNLYQEGCQNRHFQGRTAQGHLARNQQVYAFYIRRPKNIVHERQISHDQKFRASRTSSVCQTFRLPFQPKIDVYQTNSPEFVVGDGKNYPTPQKNPFDL